MDFDGDCLEKETAPNSFGAMLFIGISRVYILRIKHLANFYLKIPLVKD
jgi:hypothetical protein